jgi:hypothetical protein
MFGGFTMRKRLLFFVMGVLFVFPSFAFAQGKVAIQSIDVGLWPEYDKAEMLVIDHVLLSEDTAFPIQVDLLIPANAELHTVAVGESRDAVSDQGIDCKSQVKKNCATKKEGEWLVVSITATGPAIQLEYYDPNLKKDGDQRSYTYRWLSDYDVAGFVVIFQEPFDATEFKSSLTLEDDGVHPNDNMQYYFSDVGAVPAGEELTFTVSYQKSTDTLSVSHLEIQPVDVNENTSGRVSLDKYLPYIIGGLGVILILGGLVYYWQSGRSGSKKSRRRQRSHADREETQSDVYCAQCGTRARGGDRFCRTCGSRIRQKEE